eukprot:SAG25_NODE_2183_length_1864_cov_1.059490_3_plen_95_part_00
MSDEMSDGCVWSAAVRTLPPLGEGGRQLTDLPGLHDDEPQQQPQPVDLDASSDKPNVLFVQGAPHHVRACVCGCGWRQWDHKNVESQGNPSQLL